MQLLMGMSTRRYLPARGTAGLARSLVSGKRRVPAPPPMMTATTSCGRRVESKAWVHLTEAEYRHLGRRA